MFPGSAEPEHVDRYVILGPLGEGGMGAVYAAYDPALNRKVAIKQMLAPSDAVARARFEREAQAMAQLTHPNVVQVYEISAVNGAPYIVMEFVEGCTLREWLRHASRSSAEIFEIFEGAGRGLAAAHRVGLVHRDFKPENLMICEDGRVLVVDFGLVADERNPSAPIGVSSDESVMDLKCTGAVLGTPGYAAPEQSSGALVSAKADQFSFCVTLWEALYGVRPFPDTTTDVVARAIEQGVLRMPKRRIARSRVNAVLTRGLQVVPNHRFESMEVLLAALDDRDRWRRSLPLVGGWLVAGLLAITVTLVRPHSVAFEPAVCEGMSTALTGVRDPQRGGEIEAAIPATGSHHAPNTRPDGPTVAEQVAELEARAAEVDNKWQALGSNPPLRDDESNDAEHQCK